MIILYRYADNLDLVINHANSHCSSAPVPLIVCTIYYPQFDQYFSQMVASVGLGWMNRYAYKSTRL